MAVIGWTGGKVACPECNGTGAKMPDCSVCQGYRYPRVKRVLALGYRMSDLPEIEDDGYCRCPRMDCAGDTCFMCEGDGSVRSEVAAQQLDRILICGLDDGVIPPTIYRDWYGRVRHTEDYLSLSAMQTARNLGLAHRFSSVLGDDIMLTRAGEERARVAKVRMQLLEATLSAYSPPTPAQGETR